MTTSRLAVNVDCLTDTHRISCRLTVGSHGLITTLNDPLHSLLDADDLYYSRLQQPAKIASHFQTGALNKNAVALVVVARREDLGPQAIARLGYTRVEPVPVVVATPQFEITGAVEVVKQFDPAELLLGGTARFLPLYGACAIPAQYPETSYAGAVILVNRQMVTLMARQPRGKG
jgi:hypothetical protein